MIAKAQSANLSTKATGRPVAAKSEAEFAPCGLCPGGEPVPYPDKEIVGIEGFGFDYIEPRCGTLDGATHAVLDESDNLCLSAGTLAKCVDIMYPKHRIPFA